MQLAPQFVRARWAISAVFAINGAALGSWIVHLTHIKESLGISAATLGTALLASAVGSVLTMPFAGISIQRFGSRRTTLVFGVLLLLVLPFMARAVSVAQFALTLFLIGVVNGQMDVGMNAHSVAVQHRYDRPIISSVHGWFSVGGFIGGGGAALANAFDIAPGAHLVITSTLLGIALLLVSSGLLPGGADASEEGPSFSLPKGPLLILGVLTLFGFLTEGALWDWAAVYLRTTLRSEAAVGSLGFALFSLGMAAGRFVGDRIVDRFGSINTLRFSGMLSAGGVWLALAVPEPQVAIIGFAAAGVGLANTIPILFRAAGSVPGIPAGTGLAAVTTCGYSGFLVGPPFVGYVAEIWSLRAALAIMALLCIVIALCARLISQGRPKAR